MGLKGGAATWGGWAQKGLSCATTSPGSSPWSSTLPRALVLGLFILRVVQLYARAPSLSLASPSPRPSPTLPLLSPEWLLLRGRWVACVCGLWPKMHRPIHFCWAVKPDNVGEDGANHFSGVSRRRGGDDGGEGELSGTMDRPIRFRWAAGGSRGDEGEDFRLRGTGLRLVCTYRPKSGRRVGGPVGSVKWRAVADRTAGAETFTWGREVILWGWPVLQK